MEGGWSAGVRAEGGLSRPVGMGKGEGRARPLVQMEPS